MVMTMLSNVPTHLPATLSPRTDVNHSAARSKNLSEPNKKVAVSAGELNDEQEAEVRRLKKVDKEVRAHEAAHKNAGGQFAGSASYSYAVGPDGQRYAVGGEVSIDVAPIEGDPEATLAKLDVVIAAALAPAKPSAQDRKVAAAAVAARNRARAELAEQKRDKNTDETEADKPFDVNNFGDAPQSSVTKAYEIGSALSQEVTQTGIKLSVSS